MKKMLIIVAALVALVAASAFTLTTRNENNASASTEVKSGDTLIGGFTFKYSSDDAGSNYYIWEYSSNVCGKYYVTDDKEGEDKVGELMPNPLYGKDKDWTTDYNYYFSYRGTKRYVLM